MVSPDPDQPSVKGIIEQPQHGSVIVDYTTGAYTYTPSAGFVGQDWFTWQRKDGSKTGGYGTVFIDVQPVEVSLSIDDLKPGDPSAIVPNDGPDGGIESNPEYATLHMNIGTSLPAGTEITLSINSDVLADLNVYNGIPGESGSNAILGKDANATSYTWTVGDATHPIPAAVYVIGLNATSLEQIDFHLAVKVPVETVNIPGGPLFFAAPPTTTDADQKGQEPAKVDFLLALDGTQDDKPAHSKIQDFYDNHYTGPGHYSPGVANPTDNGTGIKQKINLVFGTNEATRYASIGFTKVSDYYKDPKHVDDNLDVIGYSRGAMEAVLVITEIAKKGIKMNDDVKYPNESKSVDAANKLIHPKINFVATLAPVITGTLPLTFWPTSLPSGVHWLYQALVKFPLLVQYTIKRADGTGGQDHEFALSHVLLGHSDQVLTEMIADAKTTKMNGVH